MFNIKYMSVKTFTALQMRQDLEQILDYIIKNGEADITHRKFPQKKFKIQVIEEETNGQKLARKLKEYWEKNGRQPSKLTYKNNREMYDSLSKY